MLEYEIQASNGGDNTSIDIMTNYFDENPSHQALPIKKENAQKSMLTQYVQGGAYQSVLRAKRMSDPKMQMFKKKLDRLELAEEKGYWPGEWVCADCGYIYDNEY